MGPLSRYPVPMMMPSTPTNIINVLFYFYIHHISFRFILQVAQHSRRSELVVAGTHRPTYSVFTQELLFCCVSSWFLLAMANTTGFALTLFATLFALSIAISEDTRKPYIVHMSKSMKPSHFNLHEHWYASLINEVTSGADDGSLLLYTYDILLHGFAAKLSTAEAEALETIQGCLAIIPSSVKKMHTTHSPQFLGLSGSYSTLWPRSHYGKDVIVGVLDSGIWPESKSFRDGGLGPVPPKWKGVCESGVMFNSSHCNNKIIGARYFFKGYEATYGAVDPSEYKSARDSNGHGTHTASTVAGSAVPGASFSGFANGTAMGMASQSRLAVYKVLWGPKGAGDYSDIAAAMEKAVADGVDILSISIGGSDSPFYKDSLAITAFKAMEKGIFVSASAGNYGPLPFSIQNTAPWIITVGASSIDRQFPAPVILGNLETYRGYSFLYKTNGEVVNGRLPLVYLSQNESSKHCHSGSLHPNMVKGKIVLCDEEVALNLDLSVVSSSYRALSVAKEAGAAGMIFANSKITGAQDAIVPFDLPSTGVSYEAGLKIKAYINRTSKPTAVIKHTGLTVVGKAITAPIVAAFSARGPSAVIPEILKPDVIAPGVNILAARKGGYYIESGTSMSCPHVSGIAALIRGVHPSWSPAALKSALMTSAYLRDNKRLRIKDAVNLKAADAFALGAGHVNPAAAVDPGLVYDIAPHEYINFLCTLNYTAKQIGLLMDNNSISCAKSSPMEDLNYPSFSVLFNSTKLVEVKMRTVTNVGGAPAAYKVRVKSPPNVKISVEPKILKFRKRKEKLKFSVRFESKGKGDEEFGEILWKCTRGGTQVVRSPIAILWLD